MKKLITTVAGLFLAVASFAQYYYIPYANAGMNPKGVNTDGENPYPSTSNVGWSTIWNGNSTSLTDYSPEQTLPFAFKFNGSAVSTYKAGNFGSVSFDAGTNPIKPSAFSNLTLPNANIPDKSVCVLGVMPQNQGSPEYTSAVMTKTFGTSPNRQHWIWFNFFKDANISDGWTYWGVVLEETTNKIYVVDMKTLCVTAGNLCTNNVKISAGIQINSSTATTVAGSPNLGALQITSNVFDASDNSYYEFNPGTQPSVDATLTQFDMKKYLSLDKAPFTLTGKIRNTGSSAITSITLDYLATGGSVQSATIGGLNIAPLAYYTFSHPTKWTPALGSFNVDMTISKVNGAADGDATNNKMTKSTQVLASFVVRKPLLEGFSSSTCGPCNAGNANVKKLMANYPDQYTYVKYQMNYPSTGDPYYTAECGTRHSFYGINSIPRLELDGGFNGNSGSLTKAIYETAADIPSYVELTGSAYLNFKKEVVINANILPKADNASTNLVLHAAVVEKMTYQNFKTNGETEFPHVMKKMAPNTNGTALTALTKGTAIPKVVKTQFFGSYTLAASGATPIDITKQHSVEEFNDLAVVIWVQDKVTKAVLQSETFDVTDYSSIKNVNASELKIMPVPAQGYFQVDATAFSTKSGKVEVYNTVGQKMAESNGVAGQYTVNCSNWNNGMYLVKVISDGKETTRKIVVQH